MENKLQSTIRENVETISSLIYGLKGQVFYKALNPDEEFYELHGDPIGLVQYGLEIAKTGLVQGQKDSSGKFERVSLSLKDVVSKKSEVYLTEVSRFENLIEVEPGEPKYPWQLKAAGISVAVFVLAILAFSGIGVVATIRFIINAN